MKESLAKQFLKSDIGIAWIKTKDYETLYGFLGKFTALYTDSYEIPQPEPIVNEIKAILNKED
jgi:hypothetical protein